MTAAALPIIDVSPLVGVESAAARAEASREESMTRAPSAASASAEARPRPRDPATTSAARPAIVWLVAALMVAVTLLLAFRLPRGLGAASLVDPAPFGREGGRAR